MPTTRSASRHSTDGRPRKSPLRVATMSLDAAALRPGHRCTARTALVQRRATQRRSTAELERLFTVVKVTHTERQSRVLARLDGPVLDPAWEVSGVGLEDIILAYMSQDQALTTGALSIAGGAA
jgi:hypothetical protein